jgi:hypothetical protein
VEEEWLAVADHGHRTVDAGGVHVGGARAEIGADFLQ